MGANKFDVNKTGFNPLHGTSADRSGITVYYNFDNLGYINWLNNHKRLFWFVGVQSNHPAGGSYYVPYSYWAAMKNTYDSGWKGEWIETQSGPMTANSFEGKFRTSSTYSDILNESYADDTYHFAAKLSSGGSGNASNGWTGYLVEYEVAL